MTIKDEHAAEIEELRAALFDTEEKARKLFEADPDAFAQVYASTVSARRSMKRAEEHHRHKGENRGKMFLLRELADLRHYTKA